MDRLRLRFDSTQLQVGLLGEQFEILGERIQSGLSRGQPFVDRLDDAFARFLSRVRQFAGGIGGDAASDIELALRRQAEFAEELAVFRESLDTQFLRLTGQGQIADINDAITRLQQQSEAIRERGGDLGVGGDRNTLDRVARNIELLLKKRNEIERSQLRSQVLERNAAFALREQLEVELLILQGKDQAADFETTQARIAERRAAIYQNENLTIEQRITLDQEVLDLENRLFEERTRQREEQLRLDRERLRFADQFVEVEILRLTGQDEAAKKLQLELQLQQRILEVQRSQRTEAEKLDAIRNLEQLFALRAAQEESGGRGRGGVRGISGTTLGSDTRAGLQQVFGTSSSTDSLDLAIQRGQEALLKQISQTLNSIRSDSMTRADAGAVF